MFASRTDKDLRELLNEYRCNASMNLGNSNIQCWCSMNCDIITMNCDSSGAQELHHRSGRLVAQLYAVSRCRCAVGG
jgi:hypothetical protein